MGDESLLIHGPAISPTTPESSPIQHPTAPREPLPEAMREAMARAAITRYMDALRPPWLRRWLRT